MRGLTIQRVLLVTLFALVFVIATRVPVDTDTWWHLRSGETTLTDGMIYRDPFSHTFKGESWTNHSWGSQVMMVVFYDSLGDGGLALYTCLLAVGGMMALYPVMAGNPYLRGFLLMLGAVTAAVFWSARPQMTSFFLSGVMLFLLYSYKRNHKDWLWFIPLMMLVWGNLHAGFSIGFIFLFGFIAGEGGGLLTGREGTVGWRGVRKLMIVSVLSVGALVINPYGLEMLRVPFETVSIGALRQYIQEWQSPNFQGRETWPFIGMVFALIFALGVSKKTLDWTDFFLSIGTLFMALLYGRNIAVFSVVGVVVISVYADAALKERGWDITPKTRVTRRQARTNLALIGLVLFGAAANFAAVLSPATVDKFQRERLPVQAAEFIEATHPAGPMFNSYNYGGYLMWALPDYPVYVDGRTDLYGSDFLQTWLNTALGVGDWRETLEGVNLVVIERGSGLADALRDEAGWTQIYPTANTDDDNVVIFSRVR